MFQETFEFSEYRRDRNVDKISIPFGVLLCFHLPLRTLRSLPPPPSLKGGRVADR